MSKNESPAFSDTPYSRWDRFSHWIVPHFRFQRPYELESAYEGGGMTVGWVLSLEWLSMTLSVSGGIFRSGEWWDRKEAHRAADHKPYVPNEPLIREDLYAFVRGSSAYVPPEPTLTLASAGRALLDEMEDYFEGLAEVECFGVNNRLDPTTMDEEHRDGLASRLAMIDGLKTALERKAATPAEWAMVRDAYLEHVRIHKENRCEVEDCELRHSACDKLDAAFLATIPPNVEAVAEKVAIIHEDTCHMARGDAELDVILRDIQHLVHADQEMAA
jgi:hypothetical protein